MAEAIPEPTITAVHREQFLACATSDKGPGDALGEMLENLRNSAVHPDALYETSDIFEQWRDSYSFHTGSFEFGATLVEREPLEPAEVMGMRIELICEVSCFFALDMRSSLSHEERIHFLLAAKREVAKLLGGPAHAEKSARHEVLEDAMPYLQEPLDQSVIKKPADRENEKVVNHAYQQMGVYNDLLGILKEAGIITRFQWFINRL